MRGTTEGNPLLRVSRLTNESTIKILIAEDHSVLRLGLRLVFERAGLLVVGEAEDGAEAVKMAADCQPDVIIMDLLMPGMNGIEASALIRETDSRVKIIIFTSTDNEEHVYASLAAGVNGYCLKETSAERLVAGIKIVCNGDLWLDSSIAAKVLRALPGQKEDWSTPHTLRNKPVNKDSGGSSLSHNEVQILNLIVDGLEVSEIASRMKISDADVRLCERKIVKKLAAAKRVQSALQAVEESQTGGLQFKSKICRQCGREFETVFKCCPFDGSVLVDLDQDPLIGTVFAERYQVLGRLGSGGMSVVYKARHIFLNRLVALKLLSPRLVTDLNNSRRFRDEAETASKMRHPNIITVFDFGLSDQGQPFLVMDLIEGDSLIEVIETGGHLPVDRALNIFIQLCDGLAELHRHQVIHRDLKPSNIMLIRSDPVERACIIDFGIAKLLDQPDRRAARLTGEGEVVGSPSYISPEQAQGYPLDVRSDVYSLGCTMYQALAGALPFEAGYPYQTMLRHVKETPPSLLVKAPNLPIPKALDQCVLRTLNKNPDDRFQSMDDLKDQLVRIRHTLSRSI